MEEQDGREGDRLPHRQRARTGAGDNDLSGAPRHRQDHLDKMKPQRGTRVRMEAAQRRPAAPRSAFGSNARLTGFKWSRREAPSAQQVRAAAAVHGDTRF